MIYIINLIDFYKKYMIKLNKYINKKKGYN